MTKIANMVKTEGIHSLRSFSSTELSNNTGDVLAAAAQGPVAINRHGKPRFVVLSAEQFERFAAQSDTRRAFHVSYLGDAEAESLIGKLEASIEND